MQLPANKSLAVVCTRNGSVYTGLWGGGGGVVMVVLAGTTGALQRCNIMHAYNVHRANCEN